MSFIFNDINLEPGDVFNVAIPYEYKNVSKYERFYFEARDRVSKGIISSGYLRDVNKTVNFNKFAFFC